MCQINSMDEILRNNPNKEVSRGDDAKFAWVEVPP